MDLAQPWQINALTTQDYKNMKRSFAEIHKIDHKISLFRAHLIATSNHGLTLIELLIAASLITLVIISASNIFTSQVRSERSLLGAQSSENLRSRLSYLLESDIADGEVILNASNSDCPTVSGRLFAVKSPYLASTGGIQYACITYSQSGGSLLRTGPPILTNGSLDYQAAATTQQVANGVQINNAVISTSRTKIDFNITIPGFLGSKPRTYSVAYGTKNFRVGT